MRERKGPNCSPLTVCHATAAAAAPKFQFGEVGVLALVCANCDAGAEAL